MTLLVVEAGRRPKRELAGPSSSGLHVLEVGKIEEGLAKL